MMSHYTSEVALRQTICLTQRRVVVTEKRFDSLVAQNERQAMEIYSFDLIVEKIAVLW